MRGELMWGSTAPNAPYGMNTVSRLVRIGCGSPPNCAYGCSNPPGGSSTSVRLPNGGEFALINSYSPLGMSYVRPYDPRTAVRPLPLTSHAMPTRGERCNHCLFNPDPPGWTPASPGAMSPARP